jgi:hypothetical protein
MEISLYRSRRRLKDNIKMSLTDVAYLLLAWIMLRGKGVGPLKLYRRNADTQSIYRWDANCDQLCTATGCEVNYWTPSSAEFKNKWSYTSTNPTRLHGADREKFNFPFAFPERFIYIYSCAINTVFTLASDRPTPNTDIVFSDDDEDRNVRFWGARSRQGLPVRDAYLKAE